MSAFICSPEHIAAIATANINKKISIFGPDGWTHYTPAEVAVELMKENIRSVTYRYPDDEDGDRPGPEMLDAELIEAARTATVTYKNKLTHVKIFKLCHSLDYQSCESPDWEQTLAYKILASLKEDLARTLPGYDEANWSI